MLKVNLYYKKYRLFFLPHLSFLSVEGTQPLNSFQDGCSTSNKRYQCCVYFPFITAQGNAAPQSYTWCCLVVMLPKG